MGHIWNALGIDWDAFERISGSPLRNSLYFYGVSAPSVPLFGRKILHLAGNFVNLRIYETEETLAEKLEFVESAAWRR